MIRILFLLFISFSSQAVIVAGSDEFKRNQMSKYIGKAELIIVGKAFKEGHNQFIKIEQVLKGHPQFQNKILLTKPIIPYESDLTCGAGEPLSISDGETIIVFFQNSPKELKQLTINKPLPHDLNFYLHYPWCIWSDFWKIKMVLPPKNVMSFRLSVAHGGISSILRQISTNGRYLHSLRSVDMTVFFLFVLNAPRVYILSF